MGQRASPTTRLLGQSRRPSTYPSPARAWRHPGRILGTPQRVLGGANQRKAHRCVVIDDQDRARHTSNRGTRKGHRIGASPACGEGVAPLPALGLARDSCMTWFVRATGHDPGLEIAIGSRNCHLQGLFKEKVGHEPGHSELTKASAETTQPGDLQVKNLSGSDGTRTRDLRRDRPVLALGG